MTVEIITEEDGEKRIEQVESIEIEVYEGDGSRLQYDMTDGTVSLGAGSEERGGPDKHLIVEPSPW